MRVLVVEDDKQLAAALRRGLEGRGTPSTSRWTVPRVSGWRPRTATTHWCSTSCSRGFVATSCCARRREAGDWTPILMLTARSGPEQEAQALDAGADDFLAKPFSFVVLLARLRALVRRGAARATGGPRGRRPAAGPGRTPA